MDMEEFVSCSICMETFDENIRPRSLPCGHTFCTYCINNGIAGGLLSCAHCKKQHQASNGSDFPISYAFEALALKVRETQLGAIPKQDQMSDSLPGGSRGLSKKMQSIIHDQKSQLKSLLQICDETKKDITEYKSYINESIAKNVEFNEKILAIVQNNEAIIVQLKKEDKRVTDFLKEVEDHQKTADKCLRKADTLTNATHIFDSSEELEKVQDDLEAWNEMCKMQLPCTETIKCSVKVMRKTPEVLNLYEKDEDESASENDGLLPADVSIMGKIKIIDKQLRMDSYTHLELKSLQAKSASTMEILNRGQVFAVQRNGNHIRSGLISMRNGKTYLHCLREYLPPPDAFTIPYDEVIEMGKKNSMISFMDLAWEGSIKGRIQILLSPQTPLATHFYNLCTAQLGPSYLHTRFIRKIHKQLPNTSMSYMPYMPPIPLSHKSVVGGDYERDNGNGGAPIFQGLDNDSDIYLRDCYDGSVGTVDLERDGPRSAQFQIYNNQGCNVFKKLGGIFGSVQDGMFLIRAADNLDDIKKVRIEDCGIVLPF